MSLPKIGFVGLSHLGLNYLAASAQKGFRVTGLDIDRDKINKLKNFQVDYKEPRLEKTIYKNKKIFFLQQIFPI